MVDSAAILLIYLALGILIVLLRAAYLHDRDIIDVMLAIWLWPVTLITYPFIRLQYYRREQGRQRYLTEGVTSGRITVDFAVNTCHWKGYRKYRFASKYPKD
jgi:hypothetical protein